MIVSFNDRDVPYVHDHDFLYSSDHDDLCLCGGLSVHCHGHDCDLYCYAGLCYEFSFESLKEAAV